ncbi:hypothetical protein LWM68_00005, partial [Niabella sp. W65]|nr:hypothetical protein [Niabella sp. W65]MCH7361309.1 hypothetical protein [Niabella sp. W65]
MKKMSSSCKSISTLIKAALFFSDRFIFCRAQNTRYISHQPGLADGVAGHRSNNLCTTDAAAINDT